MTAIGIVIGTAGSVPLSAAFQHLLFDVSAHDPVTTAIAGALLAPAAVAACSVPAWRAASVDPSIVLRAD